MGHTKKQESALELNKKISDPEAIFNACSEANISNLGQLNEQHDFIFQGYY